MIWYIYIYMGHHYLIAAPYGTYKAFTLPWRHNERDDVLNHQTHDCLLNRLFGRRSTKTSKLRVTGLSAGNSPGTGEFPAQMASNAENVSIWWRHHDRGIFVFAMDSYRAVVYMWHTTLGQILSTLMSWLMKQ